MLSATLDVSVPLPLGERWLGEAESVRGISPLSLTQPFEHSSHGLLASNLSTGEICQEGQLEAPHPSLRATFSPRGRRTGGFRYGTA
jgi:hypothetical protein